MVRFDRFALVVASVIIVGCSADADDTSSPVSAPSPLAVPSHAGATAEQRARLKDPRVKAELHDRALAVSARAGVVSPQTVHAVAASDHQRSESVVSGAVVDDHVPVFVVQMTGGPFTALHHPPGVEPPQGDILTITFDAATLRILDVGYDAVAPDLNAIDVDRVDLMRP